ncbi:MAG: thiolase domain-containing protein [Thermoplasmata archaeon]
MRDVYIIGIGQTKYGEHWEKSLRALVVEAGLKAIEDANIYSKDIQAIFGGNMSAGSTIYQDNIGSLISDFSGLSVNRIPAMRIENGSASGGAAVHAGFVSVASGFYDTVLVGGVEKLTDVSMEDQAEIVSGEVDQEWELFNGGTLAGLQALMARRYMHEYGAKREEIAMLPVLSHEHGSENPYAHFRNRIKVEDVINATMVADPLTMLDMAPASDGAAVLILASEEKVRQIKPEVKIKISGSAMSSDFMSLQSRENLLELKAVRDSTEKALKMSKSDIKRVKIVETHDSSSIMGLLILEEIGLFPKGKAGKYLEEGYGHKDSRVAINTSGGLKAKGHPMGATGIGQIVESVIQLRGKAEKRQVHNADMALAINVAGTGSASISHVLEVV